MINNLSPIFFNEQDIEILKYVNPYWNKDFNKNIKKTNAWTKKFRGQNEIYEISVMYQISQLPDVAKKVSDYKNYINQRYDLLKTNLRFVRKFAPFLTSYLVVYGQIASIKQICAFLEAMEHTDTTSRSQFFINLVNEKHKTWFQKYQSRIQNFVKNDEYITMLFDEVLYFTEKINSFEKCTMLLLQYCQKLFKKKKITEHEFVEIYIETLEFSTLNNAYTYYCAQFIKKLTR